MLRAEMGNQDSMSKAELARRAGLDRTTVSDIVRGLQQADLDQLDAICDALRMPLAKLIKDADAASQERRLL